MSTDTERAAFEAWALTYHKFNNPSPLTRLESNGSCFYGPVSASWKAWQARAAIAQPAEPVAPMGAPQEVHYERGGREEAARRAIVRAAAALGEQA